MSHIAWSSAGGTQLKELGKCPVDPADRTKHLSLLLFLLLWKHRGSHVHVSGECCSFQCFLPGYTQTS